MIQLFAVLKPFFNLNEGYMIMNIKVLPLHPIFFINYMDLTPNGKKIIIYPYSMGKQIENVYISLL